MKKNKTFIPLLTVALALAFVVSCDEQEVKFEPKVTNNSASGSNLRSAPEYNGTEGDPLDLETAKKWIANFKGEAKQGEISSHYFGQEIVQNILSQEGCVGLRIYYALDENGEKKLLLIGVDSQGMNLLPSAAGRTTDGGNTIADFSYPCPSYCPPDGL